MRKNDTYQHDDKDDKNVDDIPIFRDEKCKTPNGLGEIKEWCA